MDSCFRKSCGKFVVKLNLKCVITDRGCGLRMGLMGNKNSLRSSFFQQNDLLSTLGAKVIDPNQLI